MDFQTYLNAGLSVIPVRADGSKRPALSSWAEYQKRRATPEEAAKWSASGIAIIGGEVSGGVTCIDFDTKHDPEGTIWAEFCQTVKEWGMGHVLSRCAIEQTPSGGYHVVFRSPVRQGCEKLARAKGVTEAMIETKAEGGYFIIAPTEGYTLKNGNFEDLPTLSGNEAQRLLTLCWGLDRNDVEIIDSTPVSGRVAQSYGTGKTPLDDYSEKTGVEGMLDLLQKHGWNQSGKRGSNLYLCRPGKDGKSTSASLHTGKGVFFVYSSSTEFQPGKGYGPAGVYANLEHRGDYKAAARQLVAEGYGEKREKPKEKDRPFQAPRQESRGERLLIDMDSLDSEILASYDKDEDRGVETEWPEFDFRFANNQLTIVTGWPSSGKSTFIQSIAVHLGQAHNWHTAIASIEDFPNTRLVSKLVRKLVRKTTRGPRAMTRTEHADAWKWVKEHFTIVNAAAENITASAILSECTERKQSGKPLDMLILDPWSEIDEDRPSDMTETDFIKISLKNLRKFCRAQEVHTIVLAHPTKPQRGKSGDYHELNLYDIAGSHHWRAKADNGFVVGRDLATDITSVHIQKVKFASYGKINHTSTFKFDVGTESYTRLSDGELFTQGTQQGGAIDYKTAASGEKDLAW